MTKQRLAKLERELRQFARRPCTLCWGDPIAAVEEELETDPDGPGMRSIGRTLLEPYRDRVTQEFRCRRCGAQAKVVVLERLTGVHEGEEPEHKHAAEGRPRVGGPP